MKMTIAPDSTVYGLQVHDQLSVDEELLIFMDGKIFRLSGIAPFLWELLHDKKLQVSEIEKAVVDTIGEPPEGNAHELVMYALETLLEEKLIDLSLS